MSVELKLEVPEGAFSALRVGPDGMKKELMEAAVAMWYEQGRISQGKGAEILGVSRYCFLEVLSRHGVSPFQETPEELKAAFNRD